SQYQDNSERPNRDLNRSAFAAPRNQGGHTRIKTETHQRVPARKTVGIWRRYVEEWERARAMKANLEHFVQKTRSQNRCYQQYHRSIILLHEKTKPHDEAQAEQNNRPA